ncbi:MAG: (2Fe-2S)-binding protein [Deltaproteobacteria bacterium]|nr:(2Fe-2S)-binding protein [Deltaproteobacteria bacterium]
MIVCVCEGVSDREIRASIQQGATSVNELGRRCRVGLDCGRCRDTLRGMLGERVHGRAQDVHCSETSTR